MITHPNCKINIGLHVVSKRPDGYHNLETVFAPIPLCDDLEIKPSNQFSFSQDGITIDGNPMDNLCVKAYNLLKTHYPNQIKPVAIYLHKVIPFGAGLGGGSSDAAFTLKMLNEIFSLHLTIEQLESYARQLGADCAFFIRNKVMYASERGDVFEAMSLNLSQYQIALIKPQCVVSTAEAYRGLTPQQGKVDLRKALQQPIPTWKQHIVNHFETSIFPLYPEISAIKKMLYDSGALYASMSGSGSSVYGIFDKSAIISLGELSTGVSTYILSNTNIVSE